jgi:hypothetical protein
MPPSVEYGWRHGLQGLSKFKAYDDTIMVTGLSK